MSVDLVNAQMAEAWQVQRKRWKPQLRQEESTDGQSSEVLKNQHMLHILSENEKGLLAWSESVHGFDKGRAREYAPWIQTPEREQVSHHMRTIPLRWWHSGSSKCL